MIKIDEKYKDKINAECEEEQGKARNKTIYFSDLLKIAKDAEAKLESFGVPKTYRPGCSYRFAQSGDWSKWSQAVTNAYIIRKTSGWYLDRIERVNRDSKGAGPRLFITHEAADATVRKLAREASIGINYLDADQKIMLREQHAAKQIANRLEQPEASFGL